MHTGPGRSQPQAAVSIPPASPFLGFAKEYKEGSAASWAPDEPNIPDVSATSVFPAVRVSREVVV